tara:strand:+ start:2423 stop:2749 length:327 start_codon:yes stop_codon:yes gene_type:complete
MQVAELISKLSGVPQHYNVVIAHGSTDEVTDIDEIAEYESCVLEVEIPEIEALEDTISDLEDDKRELENEKETLEEEKEQLTGDVAYLTTELDAAQKALDDRISQEDS